MIPGSRVQLRQLLAQIQMDEQAKLRDIQQDILHASSWWWRWRAEQFHQARPRPDDFRGKTTFVQLMEDWLRCDETARACLARADFLDMVAAEYVEYADIESLPLEVIAEEVA
jgi:hypothetical protein